MEAAAPRAQAVRMPRLVILWTRPAHLTRVEADAWARAEVPALAAVPGVDGTRITEVRSAAFAHPASWHWMLELDVSDDAVAGRSLQRGPIADWVRDLQLLGMRPTVMLVGRPDGAGAAA
jgi:hypothetical protein